MADGAALVWLAFYLLLVLGIGAWSLARTHSERDFFLAGQRLGLVVTAVATMSAAFSGFVFLGGPALMYRDGIVALFICAPIGVTPALLGWLVAVRLRLFAELEDVLTLPDVLARRYGSRAAAAGGAVAILLGSVGYLAAQLLALGILLQTLLGWSLPGSVAAGLAVILIYSVAGGMVAGAWTDFAQGVVMLGAALGAFAVALDSGHGPASMARSIAASEAFGSAFFAPLGDSSMLSAASLYFVFSIGTLAQPQMLHKLMMVRDLDRLRWLPLVLGGSQAACLLVWLGLGLAIPAAVATGRMAPVAVADQAVPSFLAALAPRALGGLMVVGIVAAIMSTADSFLNLAAGALRRDLPRALGRRRAATGAAALRRLRWATLWVGLAAGVLAVGYGDLIALLGTFAFGVFAAALVPALVVGLNWLRATPRAAAVSIWGGMAAAVGLELLRLRGPAAWTATGLQAGIAPGAVALALSLVALFVVSWLGEERRPDPLIERILTL